MKWVRIVVDEWDFVYSFRELFLLKITSVTKLNLAVHTFVVSVAK